MKRCGYCGKQNDDNWPTCQGCGTPLPETLPPMLPDGPMPSVIDKPVLNAGRATLVFACMFFGQMLGGMAGAAIALTAAAIRGADLTNQYQNVQITNHSILPLALGAMAGAVAAILASILLVRPALKQTSPDGAAWVIGSAKNWRFGVGLGVLVAICTALINAPLSKVVRPDYGPLTQMGLTHGAPQVIFFIMAVLIFPVVEELVFRGVMYGGYFQSFGPRKAAIIITAIFLLMHFTELIHFLPAALGILGLALAALHMRLRASAVGPAIAVHFGYNSVVATLTVVASFFTHAVK